MKDKICKFIEGIKSLFRVFNRKSKVLDYYSIIYITLVSFGKLHKRKILLPKNLDLDAHIKKYPPMDYGYNSNLKFSLGKLYYFLSLLTSIPARNKDLINEEGWVPIVISILRNNIKDIIWYKNYLITTGIIESDNTFIPKEKAMWYRWSPIYSLSEFEFKEILCPYEDRSYFSIENDEDLSKYPYLIHWYKSNKLEINDKVHNYSKAIYEAKINGKMDWSTNPNTHKKKHPKIQYESSLININKINNNIYELHLDNTVHRFHSVITNMQSDFRNFLTFGGEKLINIDVKNSQPYLVCLLLNPLFWQKDSPLPINLYMLPQNIQDLFCCKEIIAEIEVFFKNYDTSDFQPYIDTVASGTFYETFVNIAEDKLNYPISRKDAKTLIFYILFSSNQGQHEDKKINALRKIFNNEIFPKVAQLFKIIKRKHKSINRDKQHNRLACLLQSIESEIILHRCSKRIWEEGKHNVPIFTIHDSIATTVSNKVFVKKIMTDELSKCIGITPSIDTEVWSINNIKYPYLLKS